MLLSAGLPLSHDIIINGFITADGVKMSKSLGNGVNPLDMIELYGTDALRMTLAIGNTPGNDLKFDEENVKNNIGNNKAGECSSQSFKSINHSFLITSIFSNCQYHSSYIYQKRAIKSH